MTSFHKSFFHSVKIGELRRFDTLKTMAFYNMWDEASVRPFDATVELKMKSEMKSEMEKKLWLFTCSPHIHKIH